MVFWLSLLVVLSFAIFGVLRPQGLANLASEILDITIERFGWFYLVTTLAFVLFAIYLAFSKYGNIRLGSDDDEPEFSNLTWIAMLFSAGMGIGLVFWGVAEPISHYLVPPQDEAGETPMAARLAMRYVFFHWGLHPWGIYTVIAISLAYFNYRKGYKSLISSAFYPLLGDKIHGPIGKTIDILAVIATSFGVATSLGLGTMQIGGGFNHLFGLPNTITTQLLIILVVTVIFLLSATTGLERGIKYLSNTNILLAGMILIFVLIVGPTSFIIDTLTVTLGGYVQNIIIMSLNLTPFTQGSWVGQWTLFYWAWWIAWAPFVGMFIARVSKGRTIKGFILGVLLIPCIFSFVWFSVFGGTALHLEMFDQVPIAHAVKEDLTTALFITLEQLPIGTIISGIATLLIIIFFITSADSATFVLGMLSSDGSLHPPNRVKIVWGIMQSVIAATLLLSGGLEGLQTASVVVAFPFAIIMLLMCFSLLKALKEEERIYRRKIRAREKKIDELLAKE